MEAEEDVEARTPLSEVREDDELWGEVTKVSNYGAFLDVGVEVPGFLHVIYYPNKPLVGRLLGLTGLLWYGGRGRAVESFKRWTWFIGSTCDLSTCIISMIGYPRAS